MVASRRLADRTAIVTGAGSGIGRAIALRIAEEGGFVAVADIDLTAAGQTAAMLAVAGMAVEIDVTREASVASAIAAVVGQRGRLDILVNNAGIAGPQEPAGTTPLDGWRRTLDVNLTGSFICSQAVIARMQPGGRVVNIASIAGVLGLKNRIAYSTTKAALLGLARASALDLGAYGITVNCIAPGPFLTDLPASVLSEAEKKVFADRTAIGRWGKPEELVGPALLMASDAGSYITGTTLVVDGGFLAR